MSWGKKYSTYTALVIIISNSFKSIAFLLVIITLPLPLGLVTKDRNHQMWAEVD